MDNTQKWSDHSESIEKFTIMTEDEERKQKEYRARKLQSLFENAEKAVENYNQLLEKRLRNRDMGNRKYNKDTWTLGLKDRKEPEGVKPAASSTQGDFSFGEMDSAAH